jgi:hypothetical protein
MNKLPKEIKQKFGNRRNWERYLSYYNFTAFLNYIDKYKRLP